MLMSNKRFKHNVIALVYDFDGALTPQPMQEYTILPEIGIKNGKRFWNEVKREARRQNSEEIVTYMRLMLKKSDMKDFAVRRKDLKKLGRNIQYFQGVESYFERINKYVKNRFSGVKLRQYLISAGLKEIISGTKISKHFYNIFASEYYYDVYGKATFPNVIVNDTLKTQFIFRINKGMEKLYEGINSYLREEDRAVPFQNILYIGDGLTDVPCMTVIRNYGGCAIAVYKPYSPKGKDTCRELLKAERVNFIAQADYSDGSELDKLIKLLLDNMVEEIKYGRESYKQAKKYLAEDHGYEKKSI